MRIAHVIWGLELGGIETMLVNIANEQAETESVSIIVINDNINKDLENKLSSKVKLIKLNRHKNIFPLIKLNLLLLREKYDIVHVQSKELGLILLMSVIRSKFVFTIHDTGVNVKYIKQPYKLRIAISKCVQLDVSRRTNIDSFVIPNGIKIDEFGGSKVTKNEDGSIFRMVQLSRYTLPKKGQHILIRALGLLEKEGIRNFSCTFIGHGDPDPLKKLANKYNVTTAVFLGKRDQTYIREHLRNYDLLIQPSLFEGFGLTVVEGMASKLPVLVSNIEGPMEIINNGEFGYYFDVGDPYDCAKKIKEIMFNDNCKLVERAYRHICENYNVRVTAQKYIDAYKKIL